ncbi:MAG: universal stress protein [Pseudomonadota bacterium]
MELLNIMVVFDPTTEMQPALARARVIASRDDVKLHVFSCIFSEVGKSEDAAEQRRQLISAQKDIVENTVQPLREAGIEVTTEIEWDEDWYQAVVRASISNQSDLVLKSSHKHSATQRLLKPTSDRTLLRQCDCPVLLVKGEVDSGARRVLAAIDARTKSSSYEKLNGTILEFCKRFLHMDNTDVHFVSAHEGLADRPDKGALVRACGVDSENVHIIMGDPDKVIVDTARSLEINFVVIGNSARTGLSALINTNTAEKILDELDCDVLALP